MSYQELAKTIQKALNGTLRELAKEQRRAIESTYALKARTIKKLTKTSRANINNLRASVRSGDVELTLNNFSTRQKGSDLIVRLSKQRRITLARTVKVHKKNGGVFFFSRDPSSSYGLQKSPTTLRTYNKRGQTVRVQQAYKIKTKLFSAIAADAAPALQKMAADIFQKELSKL